MLKTDSGLVVITKVKKDEKDYLEIELNKEKIWTVGKKAVGEFLMVNNIIFQFNSTYK